MQLRRGLFFSLLAGLLGLGSTFAVLPSEAAAQEIRFRGEIERPRLRARVRIGSSIPQPPPARVEVRPAQPRGQVTWRSGYWSWEGRRHVWVPGRWISARSGYTWRDPYWRQTTNGWEMVPGQWVVVSTPPPVYTPPQPSYPPQSYPPPRYGSRYDDRRDRDRFDRDDDYNWDDSRMQEIRVFTSPAYGPPRSMGRRAGYYLWVDTQGVWHLRAGQVRPREREFSGRIRGAQGADVRVLSTTPQDGQDMVRSSGRGVRFDLVTYGSMEGFDFMVEGECARVRLDTDTGGRRPARIFVGGDGAQISGSSFLVCRR